MANFVLLYTGGGMPEDEAEQAKVMQAWMAWYEKLGSAVVDQGNPFSPLAKSMKVQWVRWPVDIQLSRLIRSTEQSHWLRAAQCCRVAAIFRSSKHFQRCKYSDTKNSPKKLGLFFYRYKYSSFMSLLPSHLCGTIAIDNEVRPHKP